MIKKLFLSTFLSFTLVSNWAQDVAYARMLIDSLASPTMYGRAYVMQGDSLAAAVIASQYKIIGLQAFNSDYYQPFTLNVNTYPGKVEFSVNGKLLVPGKTFAVNPGSHTDKGIYPVRTFNRKMFDKPCRSKRFGKRNYANHYIFYDIDTRAIKSRDTLRIIDSLIKNNVFGSRGGIFPKPTISWHVWARPMSENPFTAFNVHRNQIVGKIKNIEVDVEAVYRTDYVTRNVIGFIPGRMSPDSFLVVSAHYDHLGMMGRETVFPGANDNASGTAMLLDLARHYSLPENRPHYSMAFMAFSGEEAGLHGSKYYTEKPFFPLENIKFLVNLDMVGTGSDGLLVFNATTDTARVEIIEAINAKKGYVKEIRRRGVSRSSDHYYFHQNGVPSFFLLTTGGEHKHYHDIHDRPEALTLNRYNDVFRLITDFLGTF
ncbi:MAG: M28 family peptidase [Bacteroidales bacterium]|nr:M28 family peptidase [Bacteroidales bacterium]MDZ4205159.1 M28 family peptidase [Bacteroidales bacterium]